MRNLVALTLVGLLLSACGGTSGDSAEDFPESSERFTIENWEVLNSDPDGYKGATVDIVGRVFQSPQRDDDGVYFSDVGRSE